MILNNMLTVLEQRVTQGKHCNPDTSSWPSLKENCPYHQSGIYCGLHDEIIGNNKICELNENSMR